MVVRTLVGSGDCADDGSRPKHFPTNYASDGLGNLSDRAEFDWGSKFFFSFCWAVILFSPEV